MKILSSQEVHKYGTEDEKKKQSPLEKKVKPKPRTDKPIAIFYG
jgi:hypothetical protein